MDHAPNPLSAIAGHQLLRQLGQGADSTVHLAQPPGNESLVAIKLVRLPPAPARHAFIAQFTAAAAAAQQLQHAAIVQVLNYGVDGDIAWVSMEAVAGCDLSRYTRHSRLLPEQVVLDIVARVAEALAYAHRHGVVHRDVKPSNILLNWATQSVKLADFGIARGAWATQTGTGIVPGTPAFMAPELLAGVLPGGSADLYALGVTLFQLLTGRLPYEAQTMGDLLRQVAHEPPPQLLALRPELPNELSDLVTHMLAKSPAQRPSDADAIARQLRRLKAAIRPPV